MKVWVTKIFIIKCLKELLSICDTDKNIDQEESDLEQTDSKVSDNESDNKDVSSADPDIEKEEAQK